MLEPFPRGLSSKDANHYAQRVVAVVVWRSLPCYASKLPISLPSRPNHNAASPPVIDPCIRAQRLSEPTGGHHVIAGPAAQPRRGQARKPARDGAKRSGLTAPRTAGQSVLVMAAVSSDQVAQGETERDERNAQVGRQAEGDGVVPSRAEIQCECAFTYMNASSRRNLSGALTAEMNRARNEPGKGGALDSVTGIALSRRMIVTCMLGVSDPLRATRGAKKGAAKWGSLTPHWAPCSAATAARTAKPAAQSAAGVRLEAADWQEHRASFVLHKAKRAVGPASDPCVGQGERWSRVSVPPPCSPFSSPDTGNQGGRRRPCDSPADGCYGRSWDRRRGSTLTRVPASSIDSSAPRSMSSRWASSAFATMLTTTSESRS